MRGSRWFDARLLPLILEGGVFLFGCYEHGQVRICVFPGGKECIVGLLRTLPYRRPWRKPAPTPVAPGHKRVPLSADCRQETGLRFEMHSPPGWRHAVAGTPDPAHRLPDKPGQMPWPVRHRRWLLAAGPAERATKACPRDKYTLDQRVVRELSGSNPEPWTPPACRCRRCRPSSTANDCVCLLLSRAKALCTDLSLPSHKPANPRLAALVSRAFACTSGALASPPARRLAAMVAAALRYSPEKSCVSARACGGQKLIRLTRNLGHDSLHFIGLAQQKVSLQLHGKIKRAGVEAQLLGPLHFCAGIGYPVQAE